MKIDGKHHYLWRAVNQDGEVVDVCLQSPRDGKAAKRFFRRLLKTHRSEPRKIVTDKLRSYGVAYRELIPDTFSDRVHFRLGIALQPDTRFPIELATAEGLTCQYDRGTDFH